MAKANRKNNRTGKNAGTSKDITTSQEGGEQKLSCALQVLRDGLRTLDDASDLIRAALIDLESGISLSSRTSQHLNGVGKILQIKKMKDSAVANLKKTDKDAGLLPGSDRKFA